MEIKRASCNKPSQGVSHDISWLTLSFVHYYYSVAAGRKYLKRGSRGGSQAEGTASHPVTGDIGLDQDVVVKASGGVPV